MPPPSNPTPSADDLEQIKQLKGRYCFLVDTKRWADCRALLTDDCHVEMPGAEVRGMTSDEFVTRAAEMLDGVRSVHQAQTPVIEFHGNERARGVWAMFDWLEFPPGDPRHCGRPHRIGYGYYEEEYRREGGTWRISVLRLRRMRLDRLAPDAVTPEGDLGLPPDPISWLAPDASS
jgi:hypothetical protein